MRLRERLQNSNIRTARISPSNRWRKREKSLQTRLDKLLSTDRKDDVVTFEQLGVDRPVCR